MPLSAEDIRALNLVVDANRDKWEQTVEKPSLGGWFAGQTKKEQAAQ